MLRRVQVCTVERSRISRERLEEEKDALWDASERREVGSVATAAVRVVAATAASRREVATDAAVVSCNTCGWHESLLV